MNVRRVQSGISYFSITSFPKPLLGKGVPKETFEESPPSLLGSNGNSLGGVSAGDGRLRVINILA